MSAPFRQYIRAWLPLAKPVTLGELGPIVQVRSLPVLGCTVIDVVLSAEIEPSAVV